MSQDQLAGITERVSQIAHVVDENDDLHGTLKYVIHGVGVIFVNADVRPCSVSNEDDPAACTIELDVDAIEDMFVHKRDSIAIFRQGRILLKGDMGVVGGLGNLLENALRQQD